LLMHRDHDVFVRAMAARKKVVLTFLEGDSEATRTTVCGPVFYTPAAGEGEEWCYYVWDFQQKAGKHLLVLLSGRIVSIKPSDEYFERSGFTIHDGSSDSARQSS